MLRKVLVANRGEIAVRVMRTCKEMEIPTVAVYSEADATSPHVTAADHAICLGDSAPASSYLNIDKLIAAAVDSGADAVHPGYGFLAESPEFARRCEKAGLTFVGPPAAVIETLGDKIRAREVMGKAGIPVIPGTTAAAADRDNLLRDAGQIGYPVLVKAAAGGGGKGMREVETPDELLPACADAAREAKAAFGDGTVYLEKLLSAPRHIEFQILADTHGTVVHLFERECSIQRRHQKLIEETPSVALSDDLRARMAVAALTAARASGYVNAGTVEFLLDASGKFYFLEVNTRLQVEHPVTELTVGLDLVRHQLLIAAGEPLELKQEDIARRGHAIECRVYAEDPGTDFSPSPGRLLVHREPGGPGVRNDCGVCQGFEVPVEYDPILSKVSVVAENRETARRRMTRALESYAILGVRTTIPFLIDVLETKAFADGDTCTDFISRHMQGWSPSTRHRHLAAIASILAQEPGEREEASVVDRTASPWETLGSWRL